jgi:hypothetical protein
MSIKDLLIGMRIANEERDRLERMGIVQPEDDIANGYPNRGTQSRDQFEKIFGSWGGPVAGIMIRPEIGIEVEYRSGKRVTFIVASVKT